MAYLGGLLPQGAGLAEEEEFEPPDGPDSALEPSGAPAAPAASAPSAPAAEPAHDAVARALAQPDNDLGTARPSSPQADDSAAPMVAEASAADSVPPVASDRALAGPSFSVPDAAAGLPHGCTLRQMTSQSQGPHWVGSLPASRGQFQGHRSRSRSFAEGDWPGCGRTSAQAKAEVVRWLQDAMDGHQPGDFLARAPTSAPSRPPAKRKATTSTAASSSTSKRQQ